MSISLLSEALTSADMDEAKAANGANSYVEDGPVELALVQ